MSPVVSVDGIPDILTVARRSTRSATSVLLGLAAVAAGPFIGGTHGLLAMVIGGAWVLAGLLLPVAGHYFGRSERYLPPPVAPRPKDLTPEGAYLASLLLDVRATVDDRGEVLDAVLTTLEGNTSGIAIAAGQARARLRGRRHQAA
jgi:hypothetical protein